MIKLKPHTWKRRDVILLFERLELYVTSGLTIDHALAISKEGIKPRQKLALETVERSVHSGGAVSKALTVSIGLSPTIAGLVEHGESSGELARAFGTARLLMEREDELLKKCTSAMAYPVVIGLFAVVLTIGLIRGVMPQIIPMLESLHVQLPLLTRVVMAISEGLLKYGLIALIAMSTLSVGGSMAYKKITQIRSFCHGALVRMRIIGGLLHSYSLAVFLRSCGALIESGLSVSEAFPSTVRTISFQPLKHALEPKIESVIRGVPVGSLLVGPRLPPYIGPLVKAGEISGHLGASMSRAAMILDRDIEHALKRLTSLIEPVMMAGMGLVVGAIAMSIMMPIYDISKVLQK